MPVNGEEQRNRTTGLQQTRCLPAPSRELFGPKHRHFDPGPYETYNAHTRSLKQPKMTTTMESNLRTLD